MTRGLVDFAVEVDGLRDLRAEIRSIGADYTELRGVGAEAAGVVVDAARPMVPILSGALIGSVRGAGQAAGAVVRAGRGSSSEYVGPIHFGYPEHGIEPTPFLYDALDARRDRVLEVYRSGLDRITSTF